MARGQVSEEDLAKGLKGIGDFGGLSTSRVRRDNPFRDSRSEPPAPQPVKKVEVLPAVPEKQESKGAPAAVRRIEPKPVRVEMPPEAPVETKESVAGQPLAKSSRKSDVFSERVTLQISPAMRDEVERLAREIQRSKTSKGERITANTVMRVAIRHLTRSFKLNPGQAPNTEDELFDLVEETLA